MLTAADREHFMEYGYVHIPCAFDRSVAEEWTQSCFARLGYDPNDPSTWRENRIHMGGSVSREVKEIAPRAWAAMVELLGDEEHIQQPTVWSDHFIANFGERADQPWDPAGPTTPGWHKDGDFFRHYLDSPEQGLLVFVNWTDVVHLGGPTYVATDSLKVVAEFLASRPDGVLPNEYDFNDLVGKCSRFIEATGEAGDVFLLHPFTLHAASQNTLRVPRIITNPPVHLSAPFCYSRPDGDYSLVELATLNALGRESLDFIPTGSRERIIPERVKRQQMMQAQQ